MIVDVASRKGEDKRKENTEFGFDMLKGKKII